MTGLAGTGNVLYGFRLKTSYLQAKNPTECPHLVGMSR